MVNKNSEFQIFVKPVSAKCNLACEYCYYINNSQLNISPGRLMNDQILEKYISQHIYASRDKDIFFSWHGGEPSLAGLDFYRKVLVIQNNYRKEGYRIINGIQTNGTTLDDEWCRFISDENFYIGISIDGYQELHDRYRIYKDGKPSFRKVMEGYNKLKQYGVKPEILCVVNEGNVIYPLDVYRFFRDLDAEFITFIPLVEKDLQQPRKVSAASVGPEDFGRFLCAIFDEWIVNDIGKIKIQIIEEALRPSFGQEHSLCVFKKRCGGVPVVEHNGDFYSCDHFVDREHLLGNISSVAIEDLLDDERQLSFGIDKERSLPGYCLRCEVIDMCNGECPKNRFIHTPSGEDGLNYLCSGYRMFFNHIRPFAGSVKAEWERNK